MMIKTVLLGIVLVACAGIGRALSNVRKRRYENLGEILTAIRVLRLRMLNSMEPIGILLRKSDCRIFRALGNSLWEGGGLMQAWKELKDNDEKGALTANLTDDDLHVLDGFFANLGGSGRDEQNALFAATIAQMEEAQETARSRYMDASKVYTALGTLVGIGICILIV